jgi:hypothetical protein
LRVVRRKLTAFVQRFWFGELSSRNDAEVLLTHTAPGTFLLRPSSQHRTVALSYNAESGKTNHVLLERKNGLWMEVPNDTTVGSVECLRLTASAMQSHHVQTYNTLLALLHSSQQLKGVPVKQSFTS